MSGRPRIAKERADVLVVARGLAPTRERAKALILAGKVRIVGHGAQGPKDATERRVEKAGELLTLDTRLHVEQPDHPFVSRGGVKLAGALDAFGLHPRDVVAADIGASTGGFTDCLLQRGARKVYAIDVGYGQLHHTLRTDPRVVVMERTNARYLQPQSLPELVDWVVMDASFISLTKLLPAAMAITRPGGVIVAMVKPQFEAGRASIGKKGVVRDPAARTNAITRITTFAQQLGLTLHGAQDSVLAGPEGNLEAFLHLETPG
jgi:23S rRNA (cytidine1920-2'-O)/16S rRNA (cytidine1409-2'-O)-methyltransferase